MAIEFTENSWIEITAKGATGRLLVREPNALEGAKYIATLNRHSNALQSEDIDAFEATIAAHAAMLTACVLESADITPAFPANGTESERRAWILRIPFTDLARIANAVMSIGYPKNEVTA